MNINWKNEHFHFEVGRHESVSMQVLVINEEMDQYLFTKLIKGIIESKSLFN